MSMLCQPDEGQRESQFESENSPFSVTRRFTAKRIHLREPYEGGAAHEPPPPGDEQIFSIRPVGRLASRPYDAPSARRKKGPSHY